LQESQLALLYSADIHCSIVHHSRQICSSSNLYQFALCDIHRYINVIDQWETS